MGDSYKFIHIFLCLAFERELDYRDMLIDRGESTLSERGKKEEKIKGGKREESRRWLGESRQKCFKWSVGVGGWKFELLRANELLNSQFIWDNDLPKYIQRFPPSFGQLNPWTCWAWMWNEERLDRQIIKKLFWLRWDAFFRYATMQKKCFYKIRRIDQLDV